MHFPRVPRLVWLLSLSVAFLLIGFGIARAVPTTAQAAAVPQRAVAAAPADVEPPPSNIGSSVSLSYQGPPPSSFQKELIGPYLLLRAATVDTKNSTATFPLYHGKMSTGEDVWYVLTDSSDKGNADALGLNYSAKLAYANVGKAARRAQLQKDGTLVFFSGKVDFKPERKLVPGDAPNYFPPKSAQPGSVGDANYSPLAHIENAGDLVYNAPVVAFGATADQINYCKDDVAMAGGAPAAPGEKKLKTVDHALVHDKVLAICPKDMTVTVDLTEGFSFGRPILYTSWDANDPVAATLEASTLAPGLTDIRVGADDGFLSPVERLFAFVNGQEGLQNPQQQGLNSAIHDGTDPKNIFGGIPTVATDYSPMWDFNLGQWTQKAIDSSLRSRLNDEFTYLKFVQLGYITGPGGKAFGSTGIVINCPVVFRFL